MKSTELKSIGLIELNEFDYRVINGGSFAYDVGWLIRALLYNGSNNPAAIAAWKAEQMALDAMK